MHHRYMCETRRKSCGEVGIESEVITMPEYTTEQELLEVVERLNEDEDGGRDPGTAAAAKAD